MTGPAAVPGDRRSPISFYRKAFDFRVTVLLKVLSRQGLECEKLDATRELRRARSLETAYAALVERRRRRQIPGIRIAAAQKPDASALSGRNWVARVMRWLRQLTSVSR